MRDYIVVVPDGLEWDQVVSLAEEEVGGTVIWTHTDVQDVLRVGIEVPDDRASDFEDGCRRLALVTEGDEEEDDP